MAVKINTARYVEYYEDIEIDQDHRDIVLMVLLTGAMLLACLAVFALDVLAKFAGWW